ncbi:response regulator [Nitratireductor sp. CAU 1489]|uniref:Response regulator n=1 Tax=Nitratireductor arenosus TaxID=2682096 RepID=A0A844QNP9_9HYPH|nr:response regulator [Nitratireductor arenosus]MVA99229.1 response regulator [Nitratireductor arenosus]
MERARILIVEDEPNIVESLRFILERADFAVQAVASGADALERLRHDRFSAAVLDVMLPGMNGFELLRAIRADPALARLPVLVLTAKGQAADRRTAETIGADAFITKPFSNADVVARVRSIVGA